MTRKQLLQLEANALATLETVRTELSKLDKPVKKVDKVVEAAVKDQQEKYYRKHSKVA